MQDLHSYYKVNADLTKEKLRSYGFRLSKGKCYYDSWVYKDFIRLTVIIDLSDLYYTYQVKDINSGTLYAPYYYHTGGENQVLATVIRNVKCEFEKLCKSLILEKKRAKNARNKKGR